MIISNISYGKGTVSRSPYGAIHLLRCGLDEHGKPQSELACSTRHDSWQLFGDEWFDHEYEAADKILKDPHGCKRCQRLIREKTDVFPNQRESYKALIADGRKITAIRCIQKQLQCGLRHAKDVADEIQKEIEHDFLIRKNEVDI